MDAVLRKIWNAINKKQYAYPFLTAIVAGLLTHFPVLVNKLPNSDAMANFYSDQNMITSGRWFLGVVCGISSFYDLNWIIGVLSVFYLAVAAVILCEFFDVKSMVNRMLIAMLLVTFPAVCATFAYMYTMDGYMLGVILALLAALVAKKYKWGFAAGAVCLGFSLGIYQAYLAMTILLCVFDMMNDCLNHKTVKELWSKGWRYLVMGMGGGAFYYICLKILLAIQGKELDTYQGINQMGRINLQQLPDTLFQVIKDFAAFALKGNIFINNGFSFAAVVLLGVVAVTAALFCYAKSDGKRKWYQVIFLFLFIMLLPFATNVVIIVSTEAYYHLLMRMQWVLYPVYAVVLTDMVCAVLAHEKVSNENKKAKRVNLPLMFSVTVMLSVTGLSYLFALADNIAYFNMNERYERTYAYCLRLLDRMEETPGYEPGMKVAMIGVVDEGKYPDTDITGSVTSRISGAGGSILVYKRIQYAAFMQHYMNATFDVVTDEEMIEIYNSEEYREMDSFPAQNSMRVVDGILYIKTEEKE